MKKKGILILIICLLLVGAFAAAALMDRKEVTVDDHAGTSPTADRYNAPHTIVYRGKTYRQNEKLNTILLVGVDNFGPVEESEVFYNEGQGDFLMLAILDDEAKTFRLLHINRDTITPVTMLGLGGVDTGTAEMQIALAHCYGKGLEDSCVNTVSAVSELLNGTEIDHYFAMNMDGVALLNDAVGGVTVTIEDKFYEMPELELGETVTLKGDQALVFVRGRMEVADGTNVNRMQRQRSYISAFMESLDQHIQDNNFLETAYSLISSYAVTDLPLQELSDLATAISEYRFEGVETIEGDVSYANEYVEFYPDHSALTEKLIGLLYAPVEE